MGLPMANIHEPSVRNRPYNEKETGTDNLQGLMKQKENVEAELSALGSVLDSVRLC